ncbi:MAG: nitrogen regulation protein NR(I) [Gammaproteobacteria bacterium]|nr:nitrogen regulation protein NR(I) [Gammaproteobacteria bacterium]MYE51525.1 nitrogen regulation protein NR(I) [Gammaproteobacteria bacterium]MYF52042.1 nitrogen regulation protein NR(I) [Gammaproteobacteria bacterium]
MNGGKAPTVWIVDDDRSIRWVLEKAMTRAGIATSSFASADEALASGQLPAAVLSDIRMPGTDGLDFLDALREQEPELPVIIMTAHSDLDSAVASYHRGAFEYLPKPFDIDEAVAVVQRAMARAERQEAHSLQVAASDQEILGQAPAMQEVFRAIGRLSASNVTVLINGPSGSGKELVANALHRHSPRSQQPFVALNVSAIPSELVESELFGHEKGAFTGAASRRIGRFEQANGGTLFLDEIGDMPAESQIRLLRVIAEGEFYRVGGHNPVQVDVRIITATHQHLEQRVEDGTFREDLFHRLNVIRVHVPALAERREDIPLLANHFLQRATNELGEAPKVFDPTTLKTLSALPWPGNVRQLENTCRWLAVMVAGPVVLVDDLPPELKEAPPPSEAGNWEDALAKWAGEALAEEGGQPLLKHALPAFERTLIKAALARTGGRRVEAAERLGWGRNTLTRKIAELRLNEL